MKKTLTTFVAATVLSLGLGTVGATAAEAAAPAPKGCVTKAEYKKVKNGMTKAKVHKIFGTKGIRVTNSNGVEGRGYVTCTSRKGGVGVVYSGGKVVSKAAQWR